MNIKDEVQRNYRSLIELSDSLMVINYKGEIVYYSFKSKDLFGDKELNGECILSLFQDNPTLKKVFTNRIYNLPVEAIVKQNGYKTFVVLSVLKRTRIEFIDRLACLGFLCVTINYKSMPTSTKLLSRWFIIISTTVIAIGVIGMFIWGHSKVLPNLDPNNHELQNKPTDN